MEKWVVSAKKADFKKISEQFGIDQVTARIIRNRDVLGEEAIEEYLHGNLEHLHEPKKMKDMERAVSILQEKIQKRKKIRIIGDYDIDGIQSVYILYSALRECRAAADYAIPDRMADGYGVNERLVRQAAEEGVDTILTCDNGIAAEAELALAKELGMTVIITDHHEVPYEQKEDGEKIFCIPPADAVVNPKQPNCPYPFKELCGGAVAFKLVQALFERMKFLPEKAFAYLENAAFATVGDVMPLTGENRILVKEGLKSLNRTKNYGMRALAARNQIELGKIKAYHIGFVLGPCLNASGRLDTAYRALKMLLAEDEQTAAEYAGDLYDLNVSRKEMTEQGVKQAVKQVEETSLKEDKVLVIYLPDCHESLAGIIAGRVRERYHRPVFVLTSGEDGVKGSGRSIESYSMYEEMSKCKELFTRFGGHPMAAGLSLPQEHVEQFRQRLNENTTLTDENLKGKIVIDVPMPLDYISKPLIQEMNLLEPFGKSNEKPIFADKNLHILSLQILGKNHNVCRMQVQSQGGTVMSAVYFGETEVFLDFLRGKFGNYALKQAMSGQNSEIRVSFIYYPEINVYNGRESLQIIVKNYC
ncbi:single-stranded-DNA-specific exonuclease RecJ [Petralouisia muris]|uniref:Single-stranded-DNA-specific exonuclease RecJ n=1 Tax=Petralouisia muris TaxID=3032872 RepID=A0AC61S0Z8_9FIRM|nr:single-stranded-DNA-specific exonuclease RecJ [Petralouisia muris]TGY97958.1 single-stranded-DNA-specific exonuclease RecJ [Petralouisia muris]